MIFNPQQIFYVTQVPNAAIGKETDIALHTNGGMYIKKGGNWIKKSMGSSNASILDVVKLTQATYDALTPVATTLYIIVG